MVERGGIEMRAWRRRFSPPHSVRSLMSQRIVPHPPATDLRCQGASVRQRTTTAASRKQNDNGNTKTRRGSHE
jgi:predicted amidophosphoribosyltransferase